MTLGIGILACIAALVTGSVAALSGIIGAAVALVVCWAIAVGWVWVQGSRALRLARAEPAEASRVTRALNLAVGLVERGDDVVPDLRVMPGTEPNALVCRSRGRPVVALSEALLDTSSRTELEAVMAHCVARLRRSMLPESLFAALGRVPGSPPIVGGSDDVRAAALTRYPPGLAAALTKAGAPGASPAFWFAGDPPTHETRADRIALLEDL